LGWFGALAPVITAEALYLIITCWVGGCSTAIETGSEARLTVVTPAAVVAIKAAHINKKRLKILVFINYLLFMRISKGKYTSDDVPKAFRKQHGRARIPQSYQSVKLIKISQKGDKRD
jgi:hypothetical protein